MFPSVVLWPTENQVIDTYNQLKERPDLVGPIEYERKPVNIHEKRYGDLIWENDAQYGMYRLQFRLNHPNRPHIIMRYWLYRLTDEVKETDPMSNMFKIVYDLVKPCKVTNMVMKEFNLDDLLAQ